jgi:hypothetical protein
VTSLKPTTSLRRLGGRRTIAISCLGGLLCLLVGCGGGSNDRYRAGKTVPVSGKVTFAAKLPKNATLGIAFIPDAQAGPKAKSGSANLSPSGVIDEQGNYTLSTGPTPGAPLGKYKVRISATVPVDAKDEYSPTKSVIKEIYSDPQTTPLSAEVVESPAAGAYDFTVK